MRTLKSNTYTVYFDQGLTQLASFLNEGAYSKIFILTDENTGEHCLPKLKDSLPLLENYDLIEVDSGEENKNIDFCIGIWKMLLDFGADRNSLMINLGGGVITDMGGFAASTFKRGIPFIQIPTTLLSQVDASVGGKTGVDLDSVKNIIGTFTQPEAVFINRDFLDTLGHRQLVSGYAEVLKHGLIFDRSYFNKLKDTSVEQFTEDLLFRSVEIKNEVVLIDPKEKGLRKILNFGHTIGHAIETHSLANDKKPLLHGEAIAVGMICEAYLSHQLNKLPAEDLREVITTIKGIFPDYRFQQAIYDEVIGYMRNDKKNLGGQIGFSLLQQIGVCGYDFFVDEETIKDSLDFYNSLLA
ncbi:3-dehydroquinate synthase [Olivibacter sitiensis]|uniref:3-dehydroquinate synthase n=1 Tax=Olivibacter sitiensis TaxID=376470 RepID=UPI00040DA29A|nr:3-dehydroquinate synthase [Olivibacter sitiensis]